MIWWTCCRCEQPIDDDPHTDPETGGDVHEGCCASCHPNLAAAWGIDLEASTDDLRALAESGWVERLRDEWGRPLIDGHPGPTREQSARAICGGCRDWGWEREG